MKKYRVAIIVAAVILAALCGLGMFIRTKILASLKPTVVRIQQPQRGDLVEFVSAPGQIEPKTKVEISAKVSARIIELPYEEGARVTRGDPNANPAVPPSVLVRLDDKDLQSQLAFAEAGRAAQAAQIEVERARIASQKATLTGLDASLKQAETDLQRQKELLQSSDISQATFDQARVKVDELKSQWQAAKHTLESAELNLLVLQHNLEAADARITQAREALSYTTITSPIDGIITRINAEVGEVVIFGTMNNPGTVIMEVSDLSKMLVVAEVDESNVGKLEVGQKAIVHIDAFPDRTFEGIVDSIALAHTISFTRTKYYKTEVLLKNVDQRLHEGLTAHVEIETSKHANVLKVPTQAVLGREIDTLPLEIREKSPEVDPNKTFAVVIYRYIDGKAVATPVKIGASDLTCTVILSGLAEQDRIIVGPYKVLESIKHDQKIKDEREVKTRKETDRTKNKPDANDSKNTAKKQ